jgi:hypothetical protein
MVYGGQTSPGGVVQMLAQSPFAAVRDRRLVLFSIWIFVLLNYVYADIVMVMFHPDVYQRAAQGMSQFTVLGAAILMEVLIAMPLLNILLKRPAGRWANIIGGLVGTAFVGITLSPRAPWFYLFFGVIEIACTLFVIWYAWLWCDE